MLHLSETHIMKKHNLWLIAAIIATTAFYFATGLIQYFNYSYTGLDLAIFNEVFFNTSNGFPYDFSFHGPTYLGDHFSPFIILLIPFYSLYKSPLTLLFLQSLGLALGLIPLTYLSRSIFKKWQAHATFAISYIFSALVGSIVLSEFHMLAFFVPLSLAAYYFYHKHRFLPFITFFTLALIVREDTGIVLSMFSVLAFIDKRSLKWKLAPGILAAVFVLSAFTLIQSVSGDTYKFLVHYDHLGSSIPDIAINLFTEPSRFLDAFWYPYIITFFFYLLTPFIFLPLFSKKHLIFILPPLLQFSISNTGLLSIIQAHYMALFTPFLFPAAMFGYVAISKKLLKWKTDQNVALVGIAVASIGAFIGLSGIQDMAKILTDPKPAFAQSFNDEIVHIGKDTNHAVTNLETLPHLSGRETIYPWMYILKGKEQYKTTPITLPEADIAAIKSFEGLLYTTFFDTYMTNRKELYATADERAELVQNFFAKNNLGAHLIADDMLLLSKESNARLPISVSNGNINETIKYDNLSIHRIHSKEQKEIVVGGKTYNALPISATYSIPENSGAEYHLAYTVKKGEEVTKDIIIPLTYGLYPSNLWEENEYVTVDYQLILPENYEETDSLTLNLVELMDVEVYNNINGIDYSLAVKHDHGDILEAEKLDNSPSQ